MLPVNCGSHADYQNFVVENLRKYYPDPDAIARSTWDIIERFWTLDLSYTDELMRDKYSKFGPTPRTPSCMQRSYLLSIDFKVTSITDWAAQLKINPLYAILSGFEVGNTPGVGTFYNEVGSLTELEHRIAVKTEAGKSAKQSVVELEHRMKDLAEIIKYAEQYKANRSYHIGYKKSKNPDAYFRRYESQIILYGGARRMFLAVTNRYDRDILLQAMFLFFHRIIPQFPTTVHHLHQSIYRYLCRLHTQQYLILYH